MAAPTRVQAVAWAAKTDASNTQTITGLTSGNTLLCDFGTTSHGTRTFSILDNASGSWVEDATLDDGTQAMVKIWRRTTPCPSGSLTVTITVAFGLSASWGMSLVEVTPINAVNQAPAGYRDDVGSNNHKCTASSTSMGSDTYIHCCGESRFWSGTQSAGTNFSKIGELDPVGDGSYYQFSQDWSTTGNQSTDGPWTGSNSRPSLGVMVSYDAPASAFTPLPIPRRPIPMMRASYY